MRVSKQIAWAALAVVLGAGPLVARAAAPEDAKGQAEFALQQGFNAALGVTNNQPKGAGGLGDWWKEHTQGAPYTGRHRIIFVPPEQANALGSMIYKSMLDSYRKKGLIDDDPEAVAQIKRVCDRLTAAAAIPNLTWEYHLIDTGTVNAFAIAGGKIGVLKGILKYTQDDLGLAVVLGHEVGHVVERHLDERLSEVLLIQAGMIAGDIAAPHAIPILLPKQLLAIANMVATVNQIYQLTAYEGMRLTVAGFSRAEESEADHVGLILMAKAGYDPMLAVDFWKRMLQAYPEPKNSGLVKYWRDHPLTSERIAAEERWAPQVRDQYYKPQQ